MDANLYFLFSKVAGALLSPSTLFITAVFLGFVLVLTPWSRQGKWLLGLAFLGYIATAVFPMGYILVNLLEERFPQPRELSSPVDGIIVLGGAFNPGLSQARGQVSLVRSADRMTEFVKLARSYPDAKLVFTGGIGTLSGQGPTEAEIARNFFEEMGLDAENILFEGRSRNTAESAQITFETFQPTSQNWYLVTSAKHMPRAMGLFRKAGWRIQAYPVDYETLPSSYRHFKPDWPGNLFYIDAAVYEWGGLFVSWLRGAIDEPFPGPAPMAKVSN